MYTGVSVKITIATSQVMLKSIVLILSLNDVDDTLQAHPYSSTNHIKLFLVTVDSHLHCDRVTRCRIALGLLR
jgi:hypothetical protein